MKKLVMLLFVLLFTISTVNALDITISTSRVSYTTGETIQAEIFLSEKPIEALTFSNFKFLKDNQIIQVSMSMEKISDTYYFVYFNIPQNIQGGDYKFKVKDVTYIENNILKQISKEEIININAVNQGFSYLSQQQNQDGSFQNVQTTALAALALKNTYFDNSQLAIDYLIQNQDPTGCYPKNNCNIKDTAFALLALNGFEKNIVKTKNWLKDASNNFELGSWSLTVSSTSSGCTLNGEVINSITTPITSKSLNISCTSPTTLTLNHLYLGNTYQIFSETTSNKQYLIDDSGCYGTTYKSECDYESTGYAVWVLKQIGESSSTTYLEENPSETKTLDHVLLYLTTNNQYSSDWLLNNLQNNYWSSQSASLSQTPDYYITAFAAYALKNNPIYQDVKSYLTSKTTSNQLNSALILYFHFQEEELLPSISINPGIVNKEQLFSLTLTNNQAPIDVEITAPDVTGLPSTLYLDGSETFIIEIPNNIENFNIEIKYLENIYSIPVLLTTQNVTNLLPPPQNSITTNFPETINQTLNPDDKTEDILEFTNNWGFPLTGISFILTGTLNQIIDLEKENYEILQPNETLEQLITINKNKNPGLESYSGYLIITSEQNTITNLEFNIHFTTNQELLDQIQDQDQTQDQEQTEEEIKEQTEEKISKEEKEKSPWLWLIPFAIILIMGLLIYFLKGKKIKTKTFDEYIKNIKK